MSEGNPAQLLGVVKRNIRRADTTEVARLARFGVATIHEAMGRVGLMKPYLRPIYTGAHLCGLAVTVLMQPGDNWMLHVAAEQIQDGDIVVATCTSECDDGFFGELLATSFRARGARAQRGRQARAARLRRPRPRHVQDARAAGEGGPALYRLSVAKD
jgi:4-hydroxy-4-methyl-2-oxoglutarate aldolase